MNLRLKKIFLTKRSMMISVEDAENTEEAVEDFDAEDIEE